jgi:hypothetical protein
MSVCTPDDLGDEPGEFSERHMSAEAMVINPIRTVVGILDDLWVL